MKNMLLVFLLMLNTVQLAYASCTAISCKEEFYVAQHSNISPEIIGKIQSIYNGRVISVKPTEEGDNTIQILTKNQEIIIITVDAQGNVIQAQK